MAAEKRCEEKKDSCFVDCLGALQDRTERVQVAFLLGSRAFLTAVGVAVHTSEMSSELF